MPIFTSILAMEDYLQSIVISGITLKKNSPQFYPLTICSTN